MTSSSRSEACPDESPSSRTGIEVCMRGPEEWYDPSLIDISDSRSAESQSVISGERVKSFVVMTTFAVVVAAVAVGSDADG